MMSAPNMTKAQEAVAAATLGFGGLATTHNDDSATLGVNHQAAIQARAFAGPANPRQERVLNQLMTGRRLTNNDVRNIGGCLNGPDLIDKLRDQGLCSVSELCMEWINCIDRDGKRVRYGEYFLSERGTAKVRAWQATQCLEVQQ